MPHTDTPPSLPMPARQVINAEINQLSEEAARLRDQLGEAHADIERLQQERMPPLGKDKRPRNSLMPKAWGGGLVMRRLLVSSWGQA